MCEVDGCGKKCKTRGGIKRHKASKHPEVVIVEEAEHQQLLTQQAVDRLGPLDLKKFVKEISANLYIDECYPEEFRGLFNKFEISHNQALELFLNLKELILKFKGNTDNFLSEFRKVSMMTTNNFLPDSRAHHLLMLELSTKCIQHLSQSTHFNISSSADTTEKLSEKEYAALQYLSGHVIHKIYLKLRKSKHWNEGHFQQSINLLQSFKVEANESHKLVKAKDRGGLWYICDGVIKIFEEAEAEFKKVTAKRVTKINYQLIVKTLMSNYCIKYDWRKLIGDSLIDVDVGKDLLEKILGLFLRIRGFSYAKDIKEKHKLSAKTNKKHSLRTELKKASTS